MDKRRAKFNNVPVTKENIQHWIKRDIESLYSLAYDLLSTPGVLDVLTEKLWTNHQSQVARQEQIIREELAAKEAAMRSSEDLAFDQQMPEDATI